MKRAQIVGAGLAGCCVARALADKGISSDLWEAKDYIGGLCYDKEGDEVFQHFGPHIFHTSNAEVIKFMLQFAEWQGYCNRPVAITKKGMARLPISSETVADLKKKSLDEMPSEISGYDREVVFDNIIKDYSFKQWGEQPDTAITGRLRVQNGISGSYFGDVFEGLPVGGFTRLLERMIDCPIISVRKTARIGSDDLIARSNGAPIIWTAPIDEFDSFKGFDVSWCGTRFERTTDEFEDRIAAVYNLNDSEHQATRSTKMKLLTGCSSEDVLNEIPRASKEKHYAVMDEKTRKKLDKWIARMEEGNIYFCGRSATARYLDMDEVVEMALELAEKIAKKED